MSVAATLGIPQDTVINTDKYDPTQPALRLELSVKDLPKDHPVVHWPSFVIVCEKRNVIENAELEGQKPDPVYLEHLEKRLKIFNGEESDSEDEGRRHNMSYDSDDSFIDDDVEDGDLKVRTKIGGFFVATGDTINVEKIEQEPEEPKKEKKKQKRKRDSSDDEISPEVTSIITKLRKKISAESEFTKDSLSKISKDTTVKIPLHHKILPFLLKMDLQLFTERASIRNKVFEEICALIPYTNKNHRNLSELVERFSETIIDKTPKSEIEKLKLEWYLKTTTKRRNEQRKRTQRKIKKAVEKSKNEKEKMGPGNRPGYSDLRTDIYQIGIICNRYAKLRRMNGHSGDTDQSSRDDVFQKLLENFPKECKVQLKDVRGLWSSEQRRAEGTKKKSTGKKRSKNCDSPKKKQKREGPLQSTKFAPLPIDPWKESHFVVKTE